jgi:hypothetical protein
LSSYGKPYHWYDYIASADTASHDRRGGTLSIHEPFWKALPASSSMPGW